MWSINSITDKGEPTGGIWGGLGSDVGPIPLGTTLGGVGTGYIISCGEAGSLTMVPISTDGGVTLQVNGSTEFEFLVESPLDISVVDGDSVYAEQAGGLRSTFPLMHQAADVGPLVQLATSLVSGAQPLWAAWDANALQVLSLAGLPDSAMDNLGDSWSDAPSGSDQFASWLQTISFTGNSSLSDDAWNSWLGCTLCKAYVAGAVAATFLVVAAACVAAGSTSIAAIAAVIAQFEICAVIAGATGLSATAVAQASAIAFITTGAVVFLAEALDAICKLAGFCSGSNVTALPALPIPHPVRPAR